MKKLFFMITIISCLNVFAADTKKELVIELLEVTNMKQSFSNMTKLMSDETSDSKTLKIMENSYSEFLLPKLVEFYESTFTVGELEALVDFYKTPIAISAMGKLQSALQNLGPMIEDYQSYLDKQLSKKTKIKF